MKLGYARVSTGGQDLTAQRKVLEGAGCTRIFEEVASGGRWDRPQLQAMLEQLREDDEVVVVKLDRISRSLMDLLRIIHTIHAASAFFRSLTEAIETQSPAGRMMTQMLGAFAEFEREMIRERTKAGLEVARTKGRVGGRRPSLNPKQRREALKMVDEGRSQAEVARLFGVSRSVVCRLVKQARA